MLIGRGALSRIAGRRIDCPGGFALVAATTRHTARGREIAAAAPARHVHVDAWFSRGPAVRMPGAELWAMLDGATLAGFVQRSRGVSFAVAPEYAGDPRVAACFATFVCRGTPHLEVIIGPADTVAGVLAACPERGMRASEIRRQQMMSCAVPRALPELPGIVLRPARRADMAWLLDTHAAMCREDLGVDQVARNPDGYTRYFAELLRHGRCTIVERDGLRIGKAEVPLAGESACLVEGVYTYPEARGRGVATRLVAELVRAATVAGRLCTLYVHCRNRRAIEVYERIGFVTECDWTTAIVARAATQGAEPPVEW